MTDVTSTEAGATGRYINLGSPASQDNIGAQTLICYCKPTASGGGGFAYMLGKTAAASINGPRFFITHNAGSPYLTYGNNSTGTAGSPQRNGTAGEITYNNWQHLEMDWDGGLAFANIHLFVNGTESTYTSGVNTNGTTAIAADAANDVFLMNRGAAGNLAREFVGDVAWVARWNRVLNSTERSNVRTNGPLAEPSGLILCWANDQDYSTNAITATARSTRVTGSTPPVVALGDASGTTVACSTGHIGATGYVPTVTQGAARVVACTSGHVGATGYVPTVTQLAPITIEGAYERASVILASSTVVGSGDSAIISINPKMQEAETNASATSWMEPSADIVGVNGLRPTFRFLNYKSGGGGTHTFAWQSTRRPMFSYDDGLTWQYFDTAPTLDVGNQWIEFRNSTAFTQNKVRIGRSRQMTAHQIGDWLAATAAGCAFFTPSPTAITYTPSGAVSGYAAQSFIADEFSAQTDSLGFTVPATPFYAARINDASLMPANGNPKRIAMICSGVHAGEDHANFVAKAVVEYLIGSATKAQDLRRQYDIFFYMGVNMPGRAGGGWRGSWTQGTAGADDANRHWHETGSALEIVDKPKAVMNADRAGRMYDWMQDFHGSYLSDWSVYLDSGDTYQTAYKAQLEAEVGYSVGVEGSQVTGMMALHWRSLGVRLADIHESGDVTTKTDADITAHGQAFVRAIANMAAAGAFFIEPSTGHIGATGYVPGVVQGGGRVVACSTGHIGATGYVPGVVQGDARIVACSTGHIGATGYVPGVVQGDVRIVACSTGHIGATGYVPGVVQGSARVVACSAGRVAITGYVPTVHGGPRVVACSAGALRWSGYVPGVSAQTHVAGALTRGARPPRLGGARPARLG